MPNLYACSADDLIGALEAVDCATHTTPAPQGRWLLPPLRVLSGAAVLLGRRLERANR